jgi:hypothetical protein
MERGTVSMRVALCYDLLRFSLCSGICAMTFRMRREMYNLTIQCPSCRKCCCQSSPKHTTKVVCTLYMYTKYSKLLLPLPPALRYLHNKQQTTNKAPHTTYHKHYFTPHMCDCDVVMLCVLMCVAEFRFPLAHSQTTANVVNCYLTHTLVSCTRNQVSNIKHQSTVSWQSCETPN